MSSQSKDYVYAELGQCEKVCGARYYEALDSTTIDTVIDNDLGTVASNVLISHNPNNLISTESDGVCVDWENIPLSQDPDNVLQMNSDGLFVGVIDTDDSIQYVTQQELEDYVSSQVAAMVQVCVESILNSQNSSDDE